MSSALNFLSGSSFTNPVSICAIPKASGCIARANLTQTGLSCDIVPSSLMTVPPFRTAAATSLNDCSMVGDSRNSIESPKKDGKRRSRNIAESGVSPYPPPALVKKPVTVR